MSDEPEDAPAEKARKLLGTQDGTRTDRAQAWATLALVEAVDRQTAAMEAQADAGYYARREAAERA